MSDRRSWIDPQREGICFFNRHYRIRGHFSVWGARPPTSESLEWRGWIGRLPFNRIHPIEGSSDGINDSKLRFPPTIKKPGIFIPIQSIVYSPYLIKSTPFSLAIYWFAWWGEALLIELDQVSIACPYSSRPFVRASKRFEVRVRFHEKDGYRIHIPLLECRSSLTSSEPIIPSLMVGSDHPYQ